MSNLCMAPCALPDPRLVDLSRFHATGRMYDAVIDEIDGRRIRIGDHWLTDFANCNYLGFDLEPQIMDAMDREVRRWGTHPGWSRLLGNPRLYPDIEDRLTELLAAPDTLVLPTITHIHLSVIPVLAGAGTVLLEAQAHRTIYDGGVHARGLGATLRRFHADAPDELETLLRAADPAAPRLVCLDGVNSMSGNLPDIATIAELCRRHGATLYLDDAHGFGVIGERPDRDSPYGRRGNAVIRHLNEVYDNVVLVGGFSKAYSSLLAFVALPTAVKNHLKLAAAPYLYSGPSPTASLAGVLAGFEVNLGRGDALRSHLFRLSERLLTHIRALGVVTPNTGYLPIVELPIAAGWPLDRVADLLWQAGIYTTMAAYPLVPKGQVGFRVQLTAAHTDEQLDQLTATLSELAGAGALRFVDQRRP